jgi:hypothetical protein
MQAMPAFGAGQQFAQQVTDPRSMQSYMSPYQQAVTDVAKNAAVREAQLAQQATNLGSARQGTYGGARQALMQGERERNLLANLSNIQAQGSQSAFDRAMQAQQFGANLGLQGIQTGLQGVQAGMQGIGQGLQGVGAQQAGYAGAGQAASTLGQLGGAQQQADLARMGFQQQTGQQQQQYQQNIINQAIQDYATAQQYPYMQLSTMSNLLRGLPMQGMTTQQYQAAPSMTSQLAGLGTAAYGASRMMGMKAGGTVKGYKYGGAIDDDKLRSMAESLSVEQLQAQLRDPSLDAEERQIFADALQNKQPNPGLGALRAPTFSAAGGGIVAFQEGDLVEDDDDSSAYGGYIDEADDEKLVDAVLAAGVPAGAYGSAGRGLGGIQAGESAGVGINPSAPSGSGIRAEAKAPRGIEALTQYVLAKESGGRRYDKSGNLLTSSKGAEGEMQVMPMTQRDPGFGVKAARDNSPEEKARVGRDYLAALYNKYGDEKLAAIAYNMGPGATDKWLKAGADINKLPKETRGYIAQLAGGGIVAFQDRGLVNDLYGYIDPETGEPYKSVNPLDVGRSARGGKSIAEYYKEPPKIATVPPTADAIAMGPPKAYMRDEAAEQAELDARAAYEAQLAQGRKEKETAGAGISKLEELLTAREAKIGKQAGRDENLALILGGLAAAGGTSKNALENISKGAQTGAGVYMSGNKQRGAEENAILSGRLGIEKMRGLQDIRQAQMDQNRMSSLERNIGAREKQIEQAAFNNVTKTGLMIDSAEGQAAIAREVQRLKSQDQLLGKLYSQYGLPPIQSGGAPTLRSPEDIKKQFKIS